MRGKDGAKAFTVRISYPFVAKCTGRAHLSKEIAWLNCGDNIFHLVTAGVHARQLALRMKHTRTLQGLPKRISVRMSVQIYERVILVSARKGVHVIGKPRIENSTGFF